MSRKRLAIYATGASLILATSAMAQSNDRVNSALAVGALLGGAVQKANEANARKQWSALSADNLFCVRQSIGRNNLELEKLAAAGIGPADKRMKPLVDECSSLTSQALQTGLSCKITRSDGSAFSSVCDQAYVLEQNGSATKLSLQQYLELAFKGQNVSVKAVERDDARANRLALEEAARRGAEQKAAEDRALAAARAAEDLRLAQLKAAEERKRFLESPEGKRQLAQEAANAKRAQLQRNAEAVRAKAAVASRPAVARQTSAQSSTKLFTVKGQCPDRPNITETFTFFAENQFAAMQEASRRMRDISNYRGRGCQAISVDDGL